MMYRNAVKLSDLPPGSCLSVRVDSEEERDVALCNVDGELFALDNTCPHAGGPLGEGHLHGDTIRCPWHGWAFNVRTGQCLNHPIDAWSVSCVPLRVKDGTIQIALEKHDASSEGTFGLDGATGVIHETA